MVDLLDVRSAIVNFRISGCPNMCAHCWARGGETGFHTPLSDIIMVFDQLGDLRRRIPSMHLFFLDEPTYHPDFSTIAVEARRRDLCKSSYSFLATNGYGLRNGDRMLWEVIAGSGIEYLQFTFYGLGRDHDLFAGRRGAYDDIVLSIEEANRRGLDWVGVVVAHRGNLEGISSVRRAIAAMGRPEGTTCGVIIPLHQGRARSEDVRPTAEELENADLDFSPPWYSEADVAGAVSAEPESWAGRGFRLDSGHVSLEIAGSLEVFVSGACDCGGILGAAPGLGEKLRLGNLRDSTLAEMIDRYTQRPPDVLVALDGATPGELVSYADPDNTQVFYPSDLIGHKWGGRFLLEML